jgi:hypothetical protein
VKALARSQKLTVGLWIGLTVLFGIQVSPAKDANALAVLFLPTFLLGMMAAIFLAAQTLKTAPWLAALLSGAGNAAFTLGYVSVLSPIRAAIDGHAPDGEGWLFGAFLVTPALAVVSAACAYALARHVSRLPL